MTDTTVAKAPTARFRPVQPRNAAFWVLWVPVLIGVYIAIGRVSTDARYYGTVLIVTTVYFAFYAALLWWFTQRIDRYSQLPWRMVVTAFLWGGFAATFTMAIHANDALLEIWTKTMGQPWAMQWSAALTAPITEELAKGAGLLLLIALAGRYVRTAFDGFVLGAFLGLGFQIIEDVVYISGAFGANFGAEPLSAALTTLALRSVTGVTGHILYSAVFCAGLVYLLGRSKEPRRVGRGITLMLLGMLLHSLWDGGNAAIFWALGAGLTGVALGPLIGMIEAAIVVWIVFKMTVANERRVTREELEPEVASGVMSAELADAVTGTRRDRRRYRKDGKGVAHHRARKNQLEAAFDVAAERDRGDGQATDRLVFARAELERVTQRVASTAKD